SSTRLFLPRLLPLHTLYTLSLHDALPICTPFRNNETSVEFHFGTFRTEGSPTPPTYVRHGHTMEMCGECITWNYARGTPGLTARSEEHTSELQSREKLVCRLLLEKKKTIT